MKKRKKTEKITRVILTKEGHVMKIGRNGKLTRLHDKTDWKALRAMRDEDIDYTDAPELIDDASWATAKLAMPEPKNRITIRLDHDVLGWLKHQGSGYQTRINAILRQYMETHT